MNLSGKILKWFGWSVHYTVPDYPKAIICVAPHTSNWDFILGELAVRSVGVKAGFLMKSTWFFFPLGYFLRAIGGVAVERGKKKASLVETLVGRFKQSDKLVLAIAPEGTRKKTTTWHTGFLRIAYQAEIPVCLGAIDYPSRTILVTEQLSLTGDIDADLRAVKQYYSAFTGKYPEKFSTDD